MGRKVYVVRFENAAVLLANELGCDNGNKNISYLEDVIRGIYHEYIRNHDIQMKIHKIKLNRK